MASIKIQNGHEPDNCVQPLQKEERVSQTSLQHRRVYGSGFKQRMQIKKETVEASISRINNTQQSKNSNASDS